MLIALTGAHSTGKTTLLEELKKSSFFENYVFLAEITRSLQKKGFIINEEGENATQEEILKAHLSNLFYENAVMDRCFLDGMIYTDFLYRKGKVSSEVFSKFLSSFKKGVFLYDYIFYLSPEFPLVKDGIRSSDVTFQKEIASLFEEYIDKYRLSVYRLQGSVEERVNKIIKVVLDEIQ